MPTIFRLTSLIPPSINTRFYTPQPLASLWSGIAAFSSTRHAAITRAAREQESEEARAARLERRREYRKAHRAKESEEAREARLERQREYYREWTRGARARDSEEARAAEAQRREHKKQYNFEYKRNPDKQAKHAEHNRKNHLKNRDKSILHIRRLRAEHLRLRRANGLASFIRGSKRWAQENWSWPTHQVVLTAARIDRHCTSCNQIRRLNLWWKEKHPPQGLETEPPHDRYMCNSCFANSWELVVPEGSIEKLPPLLTSPDHPPPSRLKDTKAQ
ncbi:hypothetical protein KCU81_g3318, partial [Aureobasidium melanogenum]|uniref:Uncharacterized protein n=1 Tax=Aureobasidium melanogenum (strain CBS 110374) TaxID=1043003 RepID=A0A074VN91_AURM1